jgi:putative ABC transport system ATP-binding protein
MIACEQIAYAVQEGRGERRTILHPLSFASDTGTMTLVRGKSGAGKSTLVSIIAGVLRPSEGQVLFAGEPVSRYTAAHRDRFRRKVGLVAQRLHLFDELTALENVLLPFAPRGSNATVMQRAMRLLDALELPPRQTVHTLSGGEQQRVAIARALVTEPALLVLDEPTAHQDHGRVDVIVGLITAALERGCTVVVAAHDPRLEARLEAKTQLALQDGRLVEA